MVEDTDLGPSIIEEGERSAERQDAIDERPIHLNNLFQSRARRQLLDFFLTTAEEDAALTKSELSKRTDITRHAINDHIDDLERYGVVRNDGTARETGYSPNLEHPVFQALIQLNDMLHTSWTEL